MHTEQQTATAPKAVTITTGNTMHTDPLSPSVSNNSRLNTAMAGIMQETTRDPSTVRRGDFVDYVLPSGTNKGQERTAIVCRVWTKGNPVVQLVVFTDGLNDFTGPNGSNGIFWATSVRYVEPVEGKAMEINTWHWPSGE